MEQDSAGEERKQSDRAHSRRFTKSLKAGFVDGMLENTGTNSAKELFETIGRELGRRSGRQIGRKIGRVVNSRTDTIGGQSDENTARSEASSGVTDSGNEGQESTGSGPAEPEDEQESSSNSS